MEESFQLEVSYQGRNIIYPAKLVTMGYTYKIFVDVEGQEIIFEPDEERNLRAVVEKQDGMPAALVRLIGEELQRSLR